MDVALRILLLHRQQDNRLRWSAFPLLGRALLEHTTNPLSRPEKKKSARTAPESVPSEIEGNEDDPGITKVVDRRWYERNKHIFPASVWEEFDPEKDYSSGIRRDAQGNAFFF